MTNGARAPETAWDALDHELDLWDGDGRHATFWWRDDDAGDDTSALGALLDIHSDTGVPLALAVIPAACTPALRARLEPEPGVSVLQHGYSHKNFAGPEDRKIELDGSRPAAYVIGDLATGLQALDSIPGFVPVLVPPWNRIAPHLIPLLPEIGFRGLSALGPRTRPDPIAGLRASNVHLDLIDWRGKRTGRAGGFLGAEHVLADTIAHLEARRTGQVDSAEATGLMTHHAAMDGAALDFLRRFLDHTRAHPAVRWLDAAEVFAAP